MGTNRGVGADTSPSKCISSLEDINEAAGTTGKWNYFVFILISWTSFVSPFHSVSYQFLGATPQYWCDVPELVAANWTNQEIAAFSLPKRENPNSRIESCAMNSMNYSLAAEIGFNASNARFQELKLRDADISCDKRDFNPGEADTVVSMFDLVCDRRYIYSTTQSAVMGGKLVGALVIGYLTDLVGRRTVIIWSIPSYFIVGIITIFSPNAVVYILLKVLTALIGTAYQLTGLVLVLELCSANQRSWAGPLFEVPWAIGYMIFPGIAYYIRSFPYLQATCTLSVLTLLPLICLIPESPRWFVLKGRFQDAIDVYQSIARRNNRPLPPREQMIQVMESIYESSKSTKTKGKMGLQKFFGLWLIPKWRWIIPAIFFGWFTASMVYYGVSLNPPNLSHGKYMYTFLGGLLEIPAYFLLWPMSKYLGRKRSMILLYVVCAVAIFGAMGIQMQFNQDGNEISYSATIWLYVLFLFGKFSITCAYQLIWFYTIEIFPTDCRSVMSGECSVVGRFGSMSSPYIVDLIGTKMKWAPQAIFGSVALIAGALITILPETKDLNLVEIAHEDEPIAEEILCKNMDDANKIRDDNLG